MSSDKYEHVVDQASLRDMLAREAVESGRLPTRPPDRKSDAPRNGTSCTICAQALSPQELGYELEFAQAGREPATHFLHIPCFVAWESQIRDPASTTEPGPHDEKSPGNGKLHGQNRGPAR